MNKKFSEKILRKEIDCMIECFMNELYSTFSKKDIIGVYQLGSTNKRWDSDIDYIPGMSDIDLNIYVKDSKKVEKYFANMSKALIFSRNCERNFTKKMPKHLHIPRLQAQLHNMFVDKYPEYLAPVNSVKTIYGPQYSDCIPKHVKKKMDFRKNILSNKEYLSGIPLRIMSANSDRLRRYLNEIYWRTCSAASQILCLQGMDQDSVMCLNKTEVIKGLESKGHISLAKEYHTMLKKSLEFTLHQNINAACDAILAGYDALQICVKIAEKKND